MSGGGPDPLLAQALRWEKRAMRAEARLAAVEAASQHLRARLAEVEAERIAWAREAFSRCKEQDRQAETIEAAEARLAKVEAERDLWRAAAKAWEVPFAREQKRAEAAEARLAEVEAERATAWDDGYAYGARGRSDPPEFDQNPYRAAARGEGDRGE